MKRRAIIEWDDEQSGFPAIHAGVTDEMVEAGADAAVAHELGTVVTVQTSERLARAVLGAVLRNPGSEDPGDNSY